MKIDQNKADIHAGFLFPWQFRFLGGALIIGGGVLLPNEVMLALLLLLVGLFLLTSFSGLEIDRSRKTYGEYNSIFFKKIGSTKNYSDVEKVFVNSKIEGQKIYTAHTLSSQTFTNATYTAFLKFADGTKILLLHGKNKKVVMDKVNQLVPFLSTCLEDNTLS